MRTFLICLGLMAAAVLVRAGSDPTLVALQAAVDRDQKQLKADQAALKLYQLQLAAAKATDPTILNDQITIVNAQTKLANDMAPAPSPAPKSVSP